MLAGVALNRRWKVLGRRVNASVVAFPDRHSLLPVPNPFVVPGGRWVVHVHWMGSGFSMGQS